MSDLFGDQQIREWVAWLVAVFGLSKGEAEEFVAQARKAASDLAAALMLSPSAVAVDVSRAALASGSQDPPGGVNVKEAARLLEMVIRDLAKESAQPLAKGEKE